MKNSHSKADRKQAEKLGIEKVKRWDVVKATDDLAAVESPQGALLGVLGTFRPHRGLYEEAARERFSFRTIAELKARLASEPWARGPFRSRFYCEDNRMNPPENYIVLDGNGVPCGFCSVRF